MSSPSRKKSRSTSASDAMKLVAKPEPAPALTYAARDSFAFVEGPTAPQPAAAEAPAAAAKQVAAGLAWRFPQGGFAAIGSGCGNFAALGNGNVEAVAQVGAILVKGLEEMGQSVVELGQRNIESSLNLAKAAIGTTTLRQLVDLQTGYARDSFERLVAESGKLREISIKTASAAMQPLKQRVAQAIETLGSKAA